MTEIDRSMIVGKDTLRVYNTAAEKDRSIHYSNMQVKDNSYYNKKESLWNEP